MKLPSLQYLAQSTAHAFIRFPLSILSALVGVCAGVTLIEGEDTQINLLPWTNLMLSGGLGIGLFFCVDVFYYRHGYTPRRRWLFELGAFLILLLIYFTLPGEESTTNTSVPYIRFAIYSIVVHLVIAFIPYTGKGQINGFWNYNKLLLVRVLTSALYSGVLYGGLALALGSLDFLFDIDLHDELFGDMFVVIVGLFNTIFFLAGIPDTFDDLEDLHVYPKGIRVFAQYILLPLLILYLIILYVYGGKIIVLWSWPKGIVSYLITCVGVLGIFTILLLYPYGNQPEHGWMKKFSRWYYLVLIPLVFLLFYAIIIRMGDYGITINRYIIILLGIWLTIVSVYFATGKTNIRFIPISLAAIMLTVSFGWWGMFSVSERSQVNRLRAILENAKIIQNEKIKNEVLWDLDSIPVLHSLNTENENDNLLSDSLHNEVYSILDYLDDHHGFSSVREWYTQDIDSVIRVCNEKKKERWSHLRERNVYMRSLGLTPEIQYARSTYQGFQYSTSEYERTVTKVTGFDYYSEQSHSWQDYNPGNFTVRIDEKEFKISRGPTLDKIFTITSSDDIIVFDCRDLFKKLLAENGRESATVEFLPVDGTVMQGQWKARFIISEVDFNVRDNQVIVERIYGALLLKKSQ